MPHVSSYVDRKIPAFDFFSKSVHLPCSLTVTGSPFKFHVDSVDSGHITAYGPGLMHGVSGEPSNFTIYTEGAGAGTHILDYGVR